LGLATAMLRIILIVIATAIYDVESAHILLLFCFICLVERNHEEIDFVLHLSNVLAKNAPVLLGPLTLLLVRQLDLLNFE